jgi:hypothetical protein
MQAGERGVDVVMAQQFAGNARILRGNQIHLSQHAQRPQGDVFQIADGSRHDIQHARCLYHGVITFTAKRVCVLEALGSPKIRKISVPRRTCWR